MPITYTAENLKSIKNILVDTILLAGTSIGFLAFIVSLFPFNVTLVNSDMVIDLIGISALFLSYFFRRKLSVEFKTNMIIGMLYLLFISDILENGLHTPDIILVVIIPFLSILIYNFKVTIFLYSVCIVTYLILGGFYTSGIITSSFYDGSSDSFLRWIEGVLILSVVTFVITLFLNKFNHTIYTLLENLKKQNEDLAERESLLTAITQNIPRTFLSVIDRDLIIQFTDGIEYAAMDIDPKNYVGKYAPDIFKVFGESVVQKVTAAYQQTLKGESPIIELTVGENHLIYKMMPLKNKNGQINRVLVVAENITDRVETQKLIEENLHEKNVLLQEIHHRVKNNLAVVSGLLELQSYNVTDEQSKFILNKSTNRILSIAKVHEMLYESENFNKIPFNRYINELSAIILDSMNQEEKVIHFQTEINVEYISINQGVPLGIIFNELITNSVKYGFNGSGENRIQIEVQRQDNTFYVTYSDNGSGIADFQQASTKSLGFTLIRSLLQQIEADFSYQTDQKFELSFSFPAETEQLLPEKI